MSTHEKFRSKICRGQQFDAAIFKRADRREKERIVFTVATPQQELIGKKTNRVEIRRLTPNEAGIEKVKLMNLARKRRILDAVLTEEFSRPAELAKTVEDANGATYVFAASVESLSWNWRLSVYYR